MASSTVVTEARKSIIGVNSINWDKTGTDRTFPVETSEEDDFRNDKMVNSSDLPITVSARSKTLITGATSTAEDTDAALIELYNGVVLALPLAGGTMTGNVNFGTNNISNVGQLSMQSGGSGIDMNSTGLSECGASTFNGAVAMSTNKITGLADGTASGDAIHAGQIDTDHLQLDGSNNLTIKDDGVGIDQLSMDASGSTFSHFVISAQRFTLAGGAITETLTGFSNLTTSTLFLYGWNVQTTNVSIRSVDYVSASSVLLTISSGVITASDVVTIVALQPTVAI